MKHKRIISILSAFMLCVMPILQPLTVYAENAGEAYPYTLFAASEEEGAITSTAGNFCVNGSVATNGSIAASGNFNVNGTKLEHAGEKMIYISGKIEAQYFSGSNVNEIPEDFVLEETNININEATEVKGDVALTGNININNAFMAVGDIVFDGDVKNSNNSVIYSKYGSIVIDSQNVNLNGLVYAPFGDVVVKGQNLNLNSVIIIANKITFDCPNVNANTSNEMAKFVGNVSEKFHIPYAEWGYLPDSDGDGIPDFIADYNNWQYLIDTDGDWLPDCIEEFLGSDMNAADTDGDELPDGYEFFITVTDCTLYDSLGEGLSDGEYDFDEDGLNNKTEYSIGTRPDISDTDADNLSDGNEVYIYMTNPLVKDTDSDGLDDDDEEILGFNPNKPDTDDNGVLDGEESVYQTYCYNVGDSTNAIGRVEVSFECAGNINKHTYVEDILNKDILCSNVVGLVGNPFSIETKATFENATITFYINSENLNNVLLEDLLFLWYDEENYEFVELETIINSQNNTVSVKTTHFSRYMVVDRNVWFEAWAQELNYYSNPDYTGIPQTQYSTVLAIDCSGSMDSNDKITYKESVNSAYDVQNLKSCNRIDAATGFIENMSVNELAAVVMFDNSATTVCALTDNKERLISSLQRVSSSGGTNYDAAISESINILIENEDSQINKKIILLSDGEDTVSNYTLNTAVQAGIRIYTIGLGNSSDVELQRIADYTNGQFYKAYTADELIGIYTEIGLGEFDTTDTDGDELYDAVEAAGIRIQNGQIVNGCDPCDSDTDGDGLDDGIEINPEIHKKTLYIPTTVDGNGNPYYFVMYTNPTEKDTDGDSFDDANDYAPTRYDEINGLIYQSAKKMGIGYDGVSLADDLKTNDYSYEELTAIRKMFSVQLDSTVDDNFLNFYLMSNIFAWGFSDKEIIYDLISRFKEGTGDECQIVVWDNNENCEKVVNIPIYTNEELRQRVFESEQFENYMLCVKEDVINQVIYYDGDINKVISSMNISERYSDVSNINFYWDKDSNMFNAMTMCINDIWGSNVYIKEYSCDGNTFEGVIHICLYDHFGLDEPDVDVQKVYGNLAGFRAWFVLQHYEGYEGEYRPFINLFEYDIEFSGELS